MVAMENNLLLIISGGHIFECGPILAMWRNTQNKIQQHTKYQSVYSLG